MRIQVPKVGEQATAFRGGGTPQHGRGGFTMLELLVVVAIIGILVSLLLPAVQSAREAARRAACSNNLVQLVMAVHQYEATHQRYPSGTVNATGPIQNLLNGYHHGWLEQMLPYLETEAVYHSIDRDVSVYHKTNMPIRKLDFSWSQCPSSPQSGQGYCNYAAVHHDIEASIDVDQNGVFFLNSAVTQDEISDGIGYTIFLGEKIHESGDLGWLSGTRAILRNMGEPVNMATVQLKKTNTWGALRNYPPGVYEGPIDGMGGMSGMSGMSGMESMGDDESIGGSMGGASMMEEEDYFDGMGMFVEDRDGARLLRGTTPRLVATFVGGFASYHPGGANFAMGDGSTRHFASTISMSVYRQMGHRADGELIDIE